ncbi:DUF6346 domain-containing protein [Lentzea sp. NPDC051838]|uniref:DUF6346 domain-containing protein n=1 Tax=Lentzea sp. NPDC051838 TaxID=3154849 RepID=UPI0034252316
MKLIRALGLLFVFFVMPPLGYLTAATVWTHLGDQIEVSGTAAANETLRGVARSCERQDPITLTGGFKAWYICQVDVSAHGGPSRRMESRGFLTPDDIGKSVPVGTIHNGKDLVADRDYLRYPTLAPLALAGTVIGWVLLMAAMLWVLSRKHMPRLSSSPEEIAQHVRKQFPDEEKPADEVYVRGRKKWLKGSWVFGLLVLSVLGTIVYSGDAFEGDTTQTVLAVASWSTPVLLFLNALRKLFFWPAVTISASGVEWTGEKPSWAEIELVRLSARHELTVQRTGGTPQRVGRFGPEQADEIHRAMRKYGKTAAYRRVSSAR